MNNNSTTAILSKLRRSLAHLRNGTLLNRLQQEWHQHVKRKRLKWWKSQVGKREHFEVKIQRDVKMRFYLDSRLSKLIYCGQFERSERDFVNSFLKKGDIFVDVGANIGLFTMIAAYRVQHKGHVYAFEPYSKTYHRLIENVQLNEFVNVSAYQVALSDNSDRLEMRTSQEGFDAWNSFAQPVVEQPFTTETVDCFTWDEFAKSNNLVGNVAMIKIDVEGWEYHVLTGGFETLSRADAPVLQVEFNERAAQGAGFSSEKLYYLLEKLGYEMFIYNAVSKTLVPSPLRKNYYPSLNLIAIKYPEKVIARLRSSPLIG